MGQVGDSACASLSPETTPTKNQCCSCPIAATTPSPNTTLAPAPIPASRPLADPIPALVLLPSNTLPTLPALPPPRLLSCSFLFRLSPRPSPRLQLPLALHLSACCSAPRSLPPAMA